MAERTVNDSDDALLGVLGEPTGHRIVIAGVGGASPWSVPLLAALIALPVAALFIALATWWSVDRIEDQLVADTRADLVAQGVDPEGLRIDFDYRDGDAWAALPEGMTENEAENSVDHSLLNEIEVHVTGRTAGAASDTGSDAEAASDTGADAASGSEASSDSGTAPETGAAALGSTDVDVEVVDGDIRLVGEVLTEEQRDTLVDAAAAAFGADRVVDELTVVERDPAVDGADARIVALEEAISRLAGTTTATASLSDTALTVDASGDDDLASRLDDLIAETAPLETTVTVEPSTGSASGADTGVVDPETIDALQTDLDALADAIRANVTFATGSDVLDASATDTLDEVVAAMERHPGPAVEISGHTDNTGNADRNRSLSQARAESVVAYVIDQGIDPARLSARGAGADEPIADNDSSDGRAQNRRVELTAGASFAVPA